MNKVLSACKKLTAIIPMTHELVLGILCLLPRETPSEEKIDKKKRSTVENKN